MWKVTKILTALERVIWLFKYRTKLLRCSIILIYSNIFSRKLATEIVASGYSQFSFMFLFHVIMTLFMNSWKCKSYTKKNKININTTTTTLHDIFVTKNLYYDSAYLQMLRITYNCKPCKDKKKYWMSRAKSVEICPSALKTIVSKMSVNE